MNWSLRLRTWCAPLAGIALVAGLAWAPSTSAAEAKKAAVETASGGPYRVLAPGVMRSVDPHREEAETVTRRPVVELLAVDPDFPGAKETDFRREVRYLDFKFKPMRMIWVDVPQPNGRMKRKQIWYMVYSVTNPGKVMPSVRAVDGTFELQDSDKPIRGVLEFRIESPEVGKGYRDRVIPVAVAAVQMREDPNRKLHNSVEMAALEIKPGETVWGAAAWEDVDPLIDRFSVYVTGLTNAYRWEDTPGVYQPGDPVGKGRKFTRKTLKLNFWRPGDEYYEHEKEFRYGLAPGEVDYEWVYR